MTDAEIYEQYQAVVQLAGRAVYPARQQVFTDLAINHDDTWVAQHTPEIWQTLAKIEEIITGRDCAGDWREKS